MQSRHATGPPAAQTAPTARDQRSRRGREVRDKETQVATMRSWWEVNRRGIKVEIQSHIVQSVKSIAQWVPISEKSPRRAIRGLSDPENFLRSRSRLSRHFHCFFRQLRD